MQNLSNPFYFGRVVGGESFINRSKEISEISAKLARGQSVIIFSPRRFGKTSLVKQVISRLSHQRILCFYFDLYRITRLDEFCTQYAQSVVAAIRSPAHKLLQVLLELIPSLKPRLVFAEPGAPGVELEASFESLRHGSTLKELFDSVQKYAQSRNRRACVVFDEFQEILALDEANLIEREMRSAFQHHENVSYAFLGSKLHLMQQLFTDKSRPFYHFGEHYELSTIANEHWITFMKDRFSRRGCQIDEALCNQVIAITNGHPYYSQMLCSRLWEESEPGSVISLRDVRAALAAALASESHAFGELWDSLKPAERKVLAALAREHPAQVFAALFVAQHSLGSHSALQRPVANLIKRGIIERRKEGYMIADPLFIYWIKGEGSGEL